MWVRYNGQMMLRFWEKGFDDPFYSMRMSDGTLKLFAYYLLLHEKNPRQLVFIHVIHKLQELYPEKEIYADMKSFQGIGHLVRSCILYCGKRDGSVASWGYGSNGNGLSRL